jgi:hypothetical protein
MTLESEGAAAAGAEGAAPAAGADGAAAIVHAAPWYGELKDPELKSWVEKNNPKDSESTFKQLRDAQKMLGDQNRVSLPKDTDDITQWEGWEKLGVPKDATGYAEKIKRPTLPEGMTYDEGEERAYLEHAAKVKTPAHIVQQNLDFIAQQRIADFNKNKEFAATEQKATDDYIKSWGPEKEQNSALVHRAAKFFGLDASETEALDKGLLGGPLVLKALLKIGKQIREGSAVEGDANPIFGKDAAKAELDRINATFEARIKKGETLTAEEMKQRRALYKQVHG